MGSALASLDTRLIAPFIGGTETMGDFSGLLDRTTFLVRQQAVLEQVFGESWFRNANKADKNHPAYTRWRLCQTLIEQGSSITLTQLYGLARIALDTYPFLELTSGDTEQLYLGVFDSIGDATVGKRIRAAIKKADTYEDIMVQLYVAAWHKAQDHAIALVEIDEISFPDIRVDIEIPNIPMLIECKRLRRRINSSLDNLYGKIHRVIAKANNQIKAGMQSIPHKQNIGHRHCYGVVILDVCDLLPSEDGETNGVPSTVIEIANFVQRALSGSKNHSVHTAVIVWDIYVLDIDGLGGYRKVTCRRNTVRVHHSEPNSILPNDYMLPVFESFIQAAIFNSYNFTLTAA